MRLFEETALDILSENLVNVAVNVSYDYISTKLIF